MILCSKPVDSEPLIPQGNYSEGPQAFGFPFSVLIFISWKLVLASAPMTSLPCHCCPHKSQVLLKLFQNSETPLSSPYYHRHLYCENHSSNASFLTRQSQLRPLSSIAFCTQQSSKKPSNQNCDDDGDGDDDNS